MFSVSKILIPLYNELSADSTKFIVHIEQYPINFQVTWYGNGGSPSAQISTYNVGDTYGSLPSATLSGYDLIGWNYSETLSTNCVSADTYVDYNQSILYAHWQEQVTPPTPSITEISFYVEDDLGDSTTFTYNISNQTLTSAPKAKSLKSQYYSTTDNGNNTITIRYLGTGLYEPRMMGMEYTVATLDLTNVSITLADLIYESNPWTYAYVSSVT